MGRGPKLETALPSRLGHRRVNGRQAQDGPGARGA